MHSLLYIYVFLINRLGNIFTYMQARVQNLVQGGGITSTNNTFLDISFYQKCFHSFYSIHNIRSVFRYFLFSFDVVLYLFVVFSPRFQNVPISEYCIRLQDYLLFGTPSVSFCLVNTNINILSRSNLLSEEFYANSMQFKSSFLYEDSITSFLPVAL